MSPSPIKRQQEHGLSHRRFHPLYSLWLTLMWVMLMGELSYANLLAGLALAFTITTLLPLPTMPVGRLHISWVPLGVFLLSWAKDIFLASVKVAWLSIRRAEPPRTAIIHAPMRVESEFILALAAVLYNLQPGGAITDIDIAQRMLTIHLLDAHSPAAIEKERAAVARLELHLIRIFERSS